MTSAALKTNTNAEWRSSAATSLDEAAGAARARQNLQNLCEGSVSKITFEQNSCSAV
jgi:hypothetical protein